MIPDFSEGLLWLEEHPNAISMILRGIERETLRVTPEGTLATSGHPLMLGKALTHPWITTDFSESLLEFITPVYSSVDHMLCFLKDIHAYVAHNLGSERMWSMSMPCFIKNEDDIVLAQYGTSNIGKFKTLYREGLKNRYGAIMQMISGVHYNFSLPIEFWQEWVGIEDKKSGKSQISAGYMRLIRNYYRLGWVVPYLFGASPAICSSFLGGRKTNIPLEQKDHIFYLPYATSLRLSGLGYTNKVQDDLSITVNNLPDYIKWLKKAISTPSAEFARLGVKVGGHYRQLNANIFQIENELYSPIRPKCVAKLNESPLDALLRGGIEYIEVRSLDINPFSALGVNADQSRFLDMFLIWCLLADSPEINSDEALYTRENWNRVILEGRKPGQTIIDCNYRRQSLAKIGRDLFANLRRIAEILDSINGNNEYNHVCTILVTGFDDTSLTYSAKVLEEIMAKGFIQFGLELSDLYYQELSSKVLSVHRTNQFQQKKEESIKLQEQIENQCAMSRSIEFAEYLEMHIRPYIGK
ncbi:glutamate--cysteine ligase [Candidatus Profftia tarda]|uniref:glutamate--cysteine ligase n=1 Tax=Candidatus Profftia tarda TaxID=1177216 RepID=UPI001C2006DA|nr:glutamate--cysteine ligase [Candidatus Profftia tarda]